jgi:hypothetical protein
VCECACMCCMSGERERERAEEGGRRSDEANGHFGAEWFVGLRLNQGRLWWEILATRMKCLFIEHFASTVVRIITCGGCGVWMVWGMVGRRHKKNAAVRSFHSPDRHLLVSRAIKPTGNFLRPLWHLIRRIARCDIIQPILGQRSRKTHERTGMVVATKVSCQCRIQQSVCRRLALALTLERKHAVLSAYRRACVHSHVRPGPRTGTPPTIPGRCTRTQTLAHTSHAITHKRTHNTTRTTTHYHTTHDRRCRQAPPPPTLLPHHRPSRRNRSNSQR